MVSQVVAILLLILGYDHLQQFFILGRIALWVATVLAVASGIEYYVRFNREQRVQKVRDPIFSSRSPAQP